MSFTLPAAKGSYIYLKMTDNYNDFSGNAHNADGGYGTPTYTAAGRFDPNAMLVDAAENLLYAGGINMDTTDMSAGVWYKSASMSGTPDTHTMMDFRYNIGAGAYLRYIILSLSYHNTGPHLSIGTNLGSTTDTTIIPAAEAGPAAFVTKWHLYGFSSLYSTNRVYLYVDGINILPAGLPGGVGTNTLTYSEVGGYNTTTTPGHGQYSHFWSVANAKSDQWWRRYYAWCTGKLV